MRTLGSDAAGFRAALDCFRAGGVAVYPTDTVYGIGCLISALPALERVRLIKDRAAEKPFSVLVAGLAQAERLARFTAGNRLFARRVWPGAATLILEAAVHLPAHVCLAGTVALRVPGSPWLRRLVARLGEGIAGTSANRAGHKPAASLAEIPLEIIEAVDLAIDGGRVPGKPSAVWDCTGGEPRLVRQGNDPDRVSERPGHARVEPAEEQGMNIVIGADHAGFDLKNFIRDRLVREGYRVTDLGTDSARSVDYPDYARQAALAVTGSKAELGVLICGTGLGMAIAANKCRGIRATTCNDLFSATAARAHNNANILCLGGRILGPDLAWAITRVFLETPFAGGRHLRRVREISRLERAAPGTGRRPGKPSPGND